MNDAMLYTTGANRIIAGGIVLSSPIVKEGQASILHIRNLLGLDLVIADKVPLYNISGLFSSFYYSSDMAAELICKAFAGIIRANTHQPGIRAKTTDSLSNEIRSESFRKFDDILSSYASTMQKLGIELESHSVIGAAVDGALTGGGLQFLTTGNTGKSGAVIGALIYAAIDNVQQQQLKQELIQCAIDGVHDLILIIPQLSEVLMDQYATLIFGSEIDFKKRDEAIDRAQSELKSISEKAEILLNDIYSYAQATQTINASVKRKVYGRKSFFSRSLLGGLGNSYFWKDFRKNPIKTWFGAILDPDGQKYTKRQELQANLQPELNAFKSRMEANLIEFKDLEQKAKKMLA